MYPFEFGQVINNNCAGLFHCSLYIRERFIYPMDQNVFAWHATCQRNRDFAFSCAIDEEIMSLSPFGDGFAKKGFPGVGNVRGIWSSKRLMRPCRI